MGQIIEKVWDRAYLWIFALVEGTGVDSYIRKANLLLEFEENHEKKVKAFYAKILSTYVRLIAVLGLIGAIVARADFALLLVLTFMLGVAAPFWDLKQRLERRKKELQRDYYSLLLSLTLYVGAGLSMRNAFEKAHEYMVKDRDGYLSREMGLCVKWMKNGHMETDCYYRFGQRCGLPEYLRLGGLLSQNVRRGNSEILALFENEMTEAKEIQRHEIRRRGEQASTKLLGPMMLLLAMVLLLIMIPAFGNL